MRRPLTPTSTRSAPTTSRRPLALARVTAARGFSIVELAVSLGVFIVIAAMVSVAVARSLSTSAAVRSDRVVEQSLSAQLTKVSTVSYAHLLAGDFTVPNPCPSTATGIDGRTCLTTPAGKLVIGYRYQAPVSAKPDTAGQCTTGADPADLNDVAGTIGVCGRVLTVNGVDADKTNVFATESSVHVNAPYPGYESGHGAVKVSVRNDTGAANLTLFLVKTTDPTIVVSSAVSDGSTAYLPVPSTTAADSCTDTSPCMLALAPSTTPNTTGDLVLSGGTLSAGPAATSSSSSGMTQYLPGSGIVVGPGNVTHASVRVGPTGTGRLNLFATDNGLRQRNPVPGSVCLWATFPDGPVDRTVPACNTTAAGYIDLDTYQPYWQSTDPALTQIRFRYPTGTPIRISADHPDGVCYFAPGMVGAVASGDQVSWQPKSVCTSYTWGTPTSGLSTPVELVGGQAVVRNITWSAAPAGGAGAVGAAGWSGHGQLWTKPRLAQGCASDGTCSSVADALLEAKTCPNQYCYSGGNVAPGILTPAGAYYNDPTTGSTYTRNVVLGDVEGDPFSARLGDPAGLAGGTWNLEYKVAPDVNSGTWQVWTAGDVLATDSEGPVNLYILYKRPAGGSSTGPQPTDTVAPLFSLKENRAGATWTDVPLTIGYSSGARDIDVAGASVSQASSVKVPYTLTERGTGTGTSGATVSVSGAPTGMTVSATATDADGAGTLTVTTTAATPAGTYTLTADASGAPSTTFSVKVLPVAGTMSLVAAGGSQGGAGSATATVRDKTAVVMPGVVTSFTVTLNGQATTLVRPAQAGCTTGSDGSCTVALNISKNAPAGTYQVIARSGSVTTPAASFTVSAVAVKAAPPGTGTLTLVRGRTNTYTLTVTDRLGSPVAGQAVAHPGPMPAGVTVTNPTGTTTSQGTYTVNADVSGSAWVGSGSMTIRVGGRDLTYPVTIADQVYTVTSAALLVSQEATATFDITVTKAGSPSAGTTVTFSTDVPELSATPSAVTDASGVAHVDVTADPSTHAGAHTLTVTVGGETYPLVLNVTARPAQVLVSTVLHTNAAGQPATVYVYDTAGDPVTGMSVAFTFADPGITTTAGNATTDSNGAATFTVDVASSVPAGNYTATVSGGSLNAQVVLPVTAP